MGQGPVNRGGMGGKGGQMPTQPPQAGMGGKGGYQSPQAGMGGKGGQMPTQGGMGGKGGYRFPRGGMGGKGGQMPPRGGMGGKGGQQQNPQFQPETFNNPYANVGFGQQPQPQQYQPPQAGMGGKGGNIYQVGPDGRPLGAPGFDIFAGMNKPSQGGMNGQMPPQGGMGGKGGQMYPQPQVSPPLDPAARERFFAGQPQVSPPLDPAARERFFAEQKQMQPNTGDKNGQMQASNRVMDRLMSGGQQIPAYAQPYLQQLQQQLQGQPQPSGLAALQQPTATTQAVAPEQPYMGNYLQ